MKTILVGYDDTEPAKRALARAAELAGAFGAGLVVTSVAPVLVPAGRGAAGIDPTDPPAEHRAQLDHARQQLQGKGIETRFVNAVGDPAETIVAAAEEHDADLIVVGTREPGLLERLLGTSVSQGVSHRAHRDVLIVH